MTQPTEEHPLQAVLDILALSEEARIHTLTCMVDIASILLSLEKTFHHIELAIADGIMWGMGDNDRSVWLADMFHDLGQFRGAMSPSSIAFISLPFISKKVDEAWEAAKEMAEEMAQKMVDEEWNGVPPVSEDELARWKAAWN